MPHDIILVAMPWMSLHYPSIQLGILKPVLAKAGISVSTKTLSVTWADALISETKNDSEPITLTDYEDIAGWSSTHGLGEWIFAMPDHAAEREEWDTPYLHKLVADGVPVALIQKAKRGRQLANAFIDKVAAQLLEDQPKVVGLSTVFSQTAPSMRLARRLKEIAPHLAIVCGGANCEGRMGEAMIRLFPWIDVVVRGEAEYSAPQVFQALLANEQMPPLDGVSVRRNGAVISYAEPTGPVVNMSDVPTPDYADFFEDVHATSIAKQVIAGIALPFEASRGCWWGAKSHCTFCGLNSNTMTFRAKSAPDVLSDLRTLSARYRVLDMVSADNILDFRYLQTLLPVLVEGALDYRLFFEVKANLRRSQVRLLADAGVKVIQPGIESLSTPVLRLMKKGVSAIQNVALLKWCAFYGLTVNWNVLIGTPGEPAEEYERMAGVARDLVHFDAPNVSLLTLDRFSPYHQDPQRYGLTITGPRWFYPHVYHRTEAELLDLAYSFEYSRDDGRDPRIYTAPLRSVVEQWWADKDRNRGALSYSIGPDWLVIRDRRSTRGRREIVLGELEARLFLACDDIQSVPSACKIAGLDDDPVTLAAAEKLFCTLTSNGIMFHEDGRFIGLALPIKDRKPTGEKEISQPNPAVALAANSV